jgi:hypothetical protein
MALRELSPPLECTTFGAALLRNDLAQAGARVPQPPRVQADHHPLSPRPQAVSSRRAAAFVVQTGGPSSGVRERPGEKQFDVAV